MPQIDCNKLQEEVWEEGLLISRKTTMGICAAVNTNKNMMFAGLPGTGKTMMAKVLASILFKGDLTKKFYRLTATPGITRGEFFGDWNYHKQLLEMSACKAAEVDGTCQAEVLKDIYREENFNEGPALKAIKNNGILFIDEGNRGGEDFQNMVLEVAEEKQVSIPLLGTIKATEKGMPITIITYNETDIGTEPFSDAFNRRFMRITFKQPTREDTEIILEKKHGKEYLPEVEKIIKKIIG